MENKRTIRIVVNGKDRYISEYIRDERERLNESRPENRELPKGVRGVGRPAPHPLSKRIKRKRRRQRKLAHSKYPLLRPIGVSAVSALCIGLFFGFAILAIFTGEQVTSEDAEGKEIEAVADNLHEPEDSDLSLSLSVVQGGAFQTLDAAREAEAQFVQDGYAAVIDETEQPYRLYIGIGMEKEHLSHLITYYEAQGIDTYVKNIDVLPTDQHHYTQGEDLHRGKQLLTAMIMDAKRLFSGQEIHDKDLLKSKLADWEKSFDKTDVEGDNTSRFVHSLLRADEAMRAYRTEKELENLWEAEHFLLKAFIHYKQIVDSN